MKNSPYLSTKEAASKIGISEQRVRTLLRSGDIKGQQVGKVWVMEPEAVEDYINRIKGNYPVDRTSKENHHQAVKAISFFSGAMGLDLGFEKAGIEISLACEVDKHCRQTIVANKPDIALLGNIASYTAQDILDRAKLAKEDVDIMLGGPPCQAFSTAGARRGFKDERGNIFLKYIELILEISPKYAVIENVRGFLSAPLLHRPHSERGSGCVPLSREEMPGGALKYIVNELRKGGYSISFNLYNTANYGVPQIRERVVMICHRGKKKVPYLYPTHSESGDFGLDRWITLRESIADLSQSEAEYIEFPEGRLKYYRILKEGQYWKHLPEELQKEALGKSYYSGGGKTGFFRRLSWDRPSCTLVTSPAMPATDICHPEHLRPLSIQEYKRIQQFPDSWVVCGSLIEQYRQIGNAVPVGFGEAIGKAILAHMSGKIKHPPLNFPFSRYKGNDDVLWEAKISESLEEIKPIQSSLFTATAYTV
ncbi:MAG: DNA cytosine methyltransferase [Nostoc sp. DedQUE04]|uniref:DNA cytosine methyltransferase n=1 Tax=Nostoc sp. DedQUE04 TaxID=3075390 RepID=UPI002AD31262|nr:DNA cytosine methyltransferase [Nostoc sp. DedQUE04]MDZ8134272.1 DNA cytosine methyltransferase [Nostoc sp. DedQUE04]